MKTRTPAVVAAGSLSLALALTACGNDAADETTVEASEETEEKGGLQELLSSLGDNTDDITNYTLSLDLNMPDPELGDISMDMVYEVMDDPEAVQTTMSMPFLGEMMLELMSLGGEAPEGVTADDLGTFIVILQPGQDPLVADQHGLQGDSPWLRTDEASMDQDPDEFFDIESLPELAGAFAALEQAEETGTEEVDGVETTVVSGSMTNDDLAELDPEQARAVKDLVGSDIAGTLDVTLWIDGDGFPMRMEFSDDEADIAMEFSAIGSTAFDLPSEDEIGTV
ncbi:LppX_LprAFG lipoprotein [Nocardiopsis sp. NPDC007018]|uniref:LppX_LprAFG lipoprotein n=1 Tax=Nocardiopsis sp. NPDC007018 TaxID=3155721 RepID=UPI0033F090EF